MRTATVDAARFLRKESDFGRVAVGLRADLLLTNEDPLRDVRALRRLSGVMVAGRWIDGAERRRRLAEVPGSYRTSLARLARMIETDPAAVDRELADNDPLGNVASAVLVEIASGRRTEVFGTLLIDLHHRSPESPLTSAEALNQLGYDLLAAKRPETAVEAFRVNTVLYPASGNTYDSLAETYMRLGHEELARQLYAKALEVQPDYPNAKAAREILAAPPKPSSTAN
jgi:tetratricopeptide (TPR) repeat protein